MSEGEHFTVDSAREAAKRDELSDWVVRFLASEGSDNAPLAHALTNPPRTWIGPVRLRLDQLNRLAGPPDHPVVEPVDDDEWRDDVDDLEDMIEQGLDLPPMIVTFRDDELHLEDGNHRVEGLRRAGKDDAWSVVSFETPAERDRFLARAAQT